MCWGRPAGRPLFERCDFVANSAVSAYNVPDLSQANSSLAGVFDRVSQISAQNNAVSAQEAANLRSWQERMYQTQMDFNAQEAAKNRNWQQYMSNTSHQREIADLKAAGLNPILSAYGGNGASVTSGATASASMPSGAKGDVDTSSNSAIVSLLGSWLNSVTSLENARVSAESNQAVADKYNAMSKYVAELQANTQLTTANIQSMTSRYVAGLNLQGTKYAADSHAAASRIAATISAQASKYAADKHLEAVNLTNLNNREIADLNAAVNKELKQMDIDAKFDLKKMYPSTLWETLGSFSTNAEDALNMAFDGIGSLWNSAKGISDSNALGTLFKSLLGGYK